MDSSKAQKVSEKENIGVRQLMEKKEGYYF